MSDLPRHVVDRLVESVPVLLIVLGVILLALGFAGGVQYHGWFPIPDREGRVASGIVGALIFGLGAWFWIGRLTGVPKAEAYGITITHPKDGDSVHVVDVRGEIKKRLPDGYTLRVFRIYPGEDRFVSMGQATIELAKGKWEARDCNIGGEPGNRRRIAAYLVGPAGAALLDYFVEASQVHNIREKELRPQGKGPVYLPPIKIRTPDMIECAQVSVRRA